MVVSKISFSGVVVRFDVFEGQRVVADSHRVADVEEALPSRS